MNHAAEAEEQTINEEVIQDQDHEVGRNNLIAKKVKQLFEAVYNESHNLCVNIFNSSAHYR